MYTDTYDFSTFYLQLMNLDESSSLESNWRLVDSVCTVLASTGGKQALPPERSAQR